jgi:hypothetical protein
VKTLISGRFGGGQVVPVPGIPRAWQAYGVDTAPRWYALYTAAEDFPEHLEGQWFRLNAKSEAQAKREAATLDRKLDREFWSLQVRHSSIQKGGQLGMAILIASERVHPKPKGHSEHPDLCIVCERATQGFAPSKTG